jgi:predicted amidohydrolase YtcJ
MQKFRWLLIIPIISFISCNRVKNVDLIITNAVIYSVDSTNSLFESMAVSNDLIVDTGSNGYIDGHYTSSNRVDLEGRYVYPGFIDAHCHFYEYGLGLQQAELTGTTSFAEVLDIVQKHAELYPEGWVTGRGWDQNDWQDKSFPDRAELDRLFPDRPVVLYRIDGHAALANEVALKLAGIDMKTEVPGGEFIKENGRLTGVLVDNAVGFINRQIPRPTREQMTKALTEAQANCFGVGLTSLQEAGLNAGVIDLIDELDKNDSLKIRIYAMLLTNEKNFEAYMYRGKYKTDRLHVASVKMFADGALGSRGARLLQPYSDDPESKGLFVTDPSYIKKMAELADSCGYQVNTHCIGDAANDTVLHIYAGILKGKNDKRWRIEHAQVIAPGDFALFGEYNIIPSVQPTHATSDMYWAGDRLGERVENAYAYKRLLQQNGWLADGSDFPVENINPLYGFYAAFARRDREGYPEGGFQPEDALTREEALRAMTIWAAKAAFEENEKGSIEKGKLADFVVLDRDIMKVSSQEVYNAKVLSTWIGGKMVFPEK